MGKSAFKGFVFSVFVFACIIATPSFASCPTKANAGNGVILTRTTPFFSSFFITKNAILHERRIMVRGAEPENVSSMFQHPLTVGNRISKNRKLSLHYKADVDDLDRLLELKAWSSPVTLTDNDKTIGSGSFSVKYLRSGQIVIGECRYLVWKVENRLILKGGTSVGFRHLYSPELHLILRSTRLDANGKPVSMVKYDKIETSESF
jgi:hypothetical protein